MHFLNIFNKDVKVYRCNVKFVYSSTWFNFRMKKYLKVRGH